MKTVSLLRHAKSSWNDDNLADFDRPLNKRGLEIMPFVGEKIYDAKLAIELILSSPAKRAKQTAILIKETAQVAADIRYDERIYEASPHRLLEVIAETEDEREAIMLVGHNPGLEGLIRVLTGETQSMETAALAVIDLKIEKWSETNAACGFVRKIINPKNEIEAPKESW
ncbi:MAG TPA: histidine phosphatase family protein [Pyrinomonadaceae bacterium]|nr:histidine phosphatase family protein [Pyrinomonadaceae bacterium]